MEQPKKRKMYLKRGDTFFDKILAWHKDPEHYKLSETEDAIRVRLEKVFIWLFEENLTKPMVVKKLMEEHDIKRSQAYIDIRDSEALYGNVFKAKKEGSRALWQHRVEAMYHRAIQKKDAKLEKEALKLMAKYGEWSEAENPDFNPEKLANVNIVFGIPKEYLPYLQQSNNNGGVDDFNRTEPLDVDYEDITNEINPEANATD